MRQWCTRSPTRGSCSASHGQASTRASSLVTTGCSSAWPLRVASRYQSLALALTEQGFERLHAPSQQRRRHALVALLVGAVRVVEVVLQVPAQFAAKAQLGRFQRQRQRVRHVHGWRGFGAIGADALDQEATSFATRLMPDR